jgi:ABC-2 type transport system permease protein
MIWYFAATNFIWTLIWNRTDERLSRDIITGDLAMHIIRPVSIFKRELADAVSMRIIAILIEFIPCMIIYGLLYFPSFLTIAALLKFFCLIMFAFFMYFLITFLIGLSSFFIKNNSSLQALKAILISLSAGAYIPYEFFPDWIRNIFQLLPFQYIFYWPIQFFLNKEMTRDFAFFLKTIGSQLIWIVVLFICCKVFWKISVKRFCSAGG